MVVTTGGNVVAIKYVLLEPDIDPLRAAASRFLLAALIFTIIARALRVRFPRGTGPGPGAIPLDRLGRRSTRGRRDWGDPARRHRRGSPNNVALGYRRGRGLRRGGSHSGQGNPGHTPGGDERRWHGSWVHVPVPVNAGFR